MTKPFNIKDLNIRIPNYDTNIGQVVSDLVDAYEAGLVTSVFLVYPGKDGLTVAATGRYLELPALGLVAQEVADRVCYNMVDPFMEPDDEE